MFMPPEKQLEALGILREALEQSMKKGVEEKFIDLDKLMMDKELPGILEFPGIRAHKISLQDVCLREAEILAAKSRYLFVFFVLYAIVS